MYKKIIIITVFFVIVDQSIKLLVSNNILLNDYIELLPSFFYLTNVHNEGAAWSIFSGNVFILSLIGILALIFIFFSFIWRKELNKIETLMYSLLVGGIIGNLIDRIFLGYVIDYLGFIIIKYNFPIFNLADIGIVVSIFFIMLMTIKEEFLCKKSK